MAVFQFSALSDGQSVFFTATTDVLNFDEVSISAGDLRLTAGPGADILVSVVSGPQADRKSTRLNSSH